MTAVASFRCRIGEISYVSEARRAATWMGKELGMDETETGQFSIIVTELGTNLVKHAGGGELIIRQLRRSGRRGLEVLSLDKGPGIGNLEQSMADGYSTAGSPGNGLGAVIRLATVFDIYTAPGQGTAVLARLHSKGLGSAMPGSSAYEIGAVSVPAPQEQICGDEWAFEEQPGWAALLVVDGLGHGAAAGAAASEAVRIFRSMSESAPGALMEAIHSGIGHTRGAALAIAAMSPDSATLKFAGVGNITATVVAGKRTRGMMSHNGIVGGDIQKIQELEYPWPGNALLILHSDGLTAHWDLDKYPGLQAKHPGLIAGVLFRDFLRGRDDATVVAVRNTPKSD